MDEPEGVTSVVPSNDAGTPWFGRTHNECSTVEPATFESCVGPSFRATGVRVLPPCNALSSDPTNPSSHDYR